MTPNISPQLVATVMIPNAKFPITSGYNIVSKYSRLLALHLYTKVDFSVSVSS